MITTNDYLSSAISEIVLPDPDVPRIVGLITLAMLMASEPQLTINEAINHDDLPPMKRLNTKVKTLDVTCPTCKAKPGKRCVRMSSRGPNAQPTDIPLVMGDGKASNHKRRTEKARQAS